jgi:Cyclin, N-terminal domain
VQNSSWWGQQQCSLPRKFLLVKNRTKPPHPSVFFLRFHRKYEEIYPPEIGEFVYITDDTYTKQQVLRMEKLLLKVLSFDLSAPSTLTYINLFGCMMNIPEKVKFLAQVRGYAFVVWIECCFTDH